MLSRKCGRCYRSFQKLCYGRWRPTPKGIVPILDIPWQDIINLDLAIAAAVAVAAAVIRGLTGFGANLLWGPVLVILYGPAETVAIMGLTGAMSVSPIFIPSMRHVNWREIWTIVLAAFIFAPLGVWTLLHLDPSAFKKAMGGFILVMACVLMSGWNYKGERGVAAQLVTGGVSGWLAGFAGIGGPTCVLYFMAAPGPAVVQRANNTISVAMLIPPPLIVLALNGHIGVATLIKAVCMVAPYMFGQWLGSLLFGKLPDQIFRTVVLWLLVAIGLGIMLF